jgi:hypothetical protein
MILIGPRGRSAAACGVALARKYGGISSLPLLASDHGSTAIIRSKSSCQGTVALTLVAF